tara:strand:- start:152 stop:442 length:291 start_codon:yes stop_codon:yes gene_type:complete
MTVRNDYLEYRRYWEGEHSFRPEGCLEYLATYLSVFVRDQIRRNPNEHVSLQPAAILKALEAFPKTDGHCMPLTDEPIEEHAPQRITTHPIVIIDD